MLRDKLAHHDPIDGFRWRSHEITRVEGFSDACFGFAVTLLIVSLEVPKTSTELIGTMRGFGSFVITFFMLASVWYAQHLFFRRYGLEDKVTVVLNLALMFTVLFFVYPLKFLFGVLLSDPRMKGMVETAHGLELVVLPEHKKWIFIIFAIGYSAVFTVFWLLYRHAYRQREKLELNDFEIFETKHAMRRLALTIVVGLMYFGIALMENLPKQTRQQKNIVLAVSVTVLVVFSALLTQLARLFRERQRVKKEWLSRDTTEPHGDL